MMGKTLPEKHMGFQNLIPRFLMEGIGSKIPQDFILSFVN